jgi:transposase
MGVNLTMAREYARAVGGNRAVGTVPKNWGESVTVLGAMTSDGITAALEVRGATDEAVMLGFVEKVLGEAVAPGDVVVLDNLSSHKTRKVQAAFAALKVEMLFLPPYSPDLNPIEKCWSKMKTELRRAAARSYAALSEALAAAIKTITATDARNWIRHCGYVLH